jgi:hypothetical protein
MKDDVVADDDGVGQKSVRLDAAPQGALGGERHPFRDDHGPAPDPNVTARVFPYRFVQAIQRALEIRRLLSGLSSIQIRFHIRSSPPPTAQQSYTVAIDNDRAARARDGLPHDPRYAAGMASALI